MKKLVAAITSLIVTLSFLSINSCKKSTNPIIESNSEIIDLAKARIIVDSIDDQFSKLFYDGDSIGLYEMYAKGARFGTLKGEDILLAWGSSIRSSIKEDSRHFLFEPIFLNTDNEYLFEVGKYVFKDDNGNLKGEGKYLMVLKQEDGKWKIYRDMGL
jgi:hypothetical protein